jgi:hypothetical protein
MTCQPFTTAATNGSVFAHALWSEREATRSGYLAANHIPAAALYGDIPDGRGRHGHSLPAPGEAG